MTSDIFYARKASLVQIEDKNELRGRLVAAFMNGKGLERTDVTIVSLEDAALGMVTASFPDIQGLYHIMGLRRLEARHEHQHAVLNCHVHRGVFRHRHQGIL